MIDMDSRQDRDTVYLRTEPRRPGRWSTVLMALVLFASGVGVGWLVTSEPPAETTTVDEPSEIDVTSTVATEPSVGDISTDPLLDGPVTDEPVADVAEALLPSIVQLEIESPTSSGVGTGVIYDPNGKIMTAAHVVEGVDTVTVRLNDGSRVVGTVLGADTGNDIAVVEIPRTNLPAAPLALDEKPRVGQLAVALGSPWGLDSTVTSGIVSAVDRAIHGANGPRAMIQTDAPINPGNSGGALADRHGRVIGINVSIYSSSGANDGVGFAVPIERAYRVAQSLVEGGDFVPGYLGVQIGPSEDGSAGAVVTVVQPGTAAAEADIRLGDRIVSVDGTPIGDFVDLGAQIRAREAGDIVELLVVRDGEELALEVTLGER